MKRVDGTLRAWGNSLRWKRGGLACLAGLAFLAGAAAAPVPQQPFSRIFVFGDSLSDAGNFFDLSGGLPPSPYWQGRFSSGPVWVEHLAKAMHMTIRPGDNYAVGGATTGYDNYRDGANDRTYPGLQDQVDAFLDPAARRITHDALFVVWIGANDFLLTLEGGGDPTSMVRTGVGNTMNALQRLYAGGARHFLVVNIPDLGKTPYGLESGLGPQVTYLSATYNQALAGALEQFSALDVSLVTVDAFVTLQAMAAAPSEFCLTNATQAYLDVGAGDPEAFLFWDSVHPTTVAHEVFASVAVANLSSYYTQQDRHGLPAERIASLQRLARLWNAGYRDFTYRERAHKPGPRVHRYH